MVRPHDTIIPADTSWLIDPAARALCAAMEGAGFQIFFVGGCVRNALLGLEGSDVDLSTNALPDQTMQVARDAGFKAIPTGIDHGTITVVVNGAPFEVTTFRRDVATDGRRAVVAFSDDIAEDARRRDFTMNALYASADGKVIDPLGGLPDLLARRIRFIDDADARIKEDFLRSLRFFRFSAWYADPDEGFDADALAAIAANIAGLGTLSAERVGQEITKLLKAPDPVPAVAVMRQTGVLGVILPGADDRLLGVLVHMETAVGLPPDWITRLAVLGGDAPIERLRLSKADGRMLGLLREVGFAGPSVGEIAYRHGERIAQGVVLIRASMVEKEPNIAVLETISGAAQQVFPITAANLMPAYQGPALGQKLKELEQLWIASGFKATAQELLTGI